MSRELNPNQIAIIRESAGSVSALAIATAIGCSERTVQSYISDMGLEPYRPWQRTMTRRERLLNSASGLDFHLQSCRT